MKQLFEKANQLIQELIDIRYQQSNLFIKLDKKKDSTSIQFKIKNYIKWKSIINTHISNNTQITNISDIKTLKLTEKLEIKLCELFDTGDIKDIDDAKLEYIELERQYNSKNTVDNMSVTNSLSNSIVSIDSSIDDSEEQEQKTKELELVAAKIQSKKVKVEKHSKDTKLNTTKLESIPKNMMSITRPTDERGGSIYDLQLLHCIGEKSALILYEKGVTLEGLVGEWIQWVDKNPNNSILMTQHMERPKEYTQSKWDSLEVWNRNTILENNLKKKLETETKQLCKIHKDTLVGLKYFHDMTQKIPREEIQKAETILNRVAEYMNKDLKVILCGSYRRERDKSGDIDCCIVHPDIKTQDDIKSNQYNILASFVEMLINVGFIVDQLDM